MAFQRRQLEFLVAVDDAGSIHRAAEQLGVTQPAVSRMISEVERSVGAPLFERTADGSVATARGEALIGQARGILRALERLDAVAGTHPGPIRLGCISRAMHALVPRLLAQQASAGARMMRLRLVEGDSAQLSGALQRGELDFAVMGQVATANVIRSPLVVRPLYTERLVVVAAPDNDLQHSRRLNLARLHGHGWVLPAAGTPMRGLLDDHCRRLHLPPIEPLVETASFESSAALLQGTALLAPMSELIARQYQREGRVVVLHLAPPLATLPVMLFARQAVSEDPMLATLQRQLQAAALQTRVALASAGRQRPVGPQ